MRLLNVSLFLATILAGASWVGAQTQIDVATQSKNIDFSQKPAILFRRGSTLPPACSPGEGYLRTDVAAGSNFYVCLAANSWTLQASSAGMSAVVTPAPDSVPKSGADGKLAQGWIDFTGYQQSLGYAPLKPARNLSDVSSPATARTNLGLGTAATVSLVTSVGSHGIDTNVPSEKAVRDAIAAAGLTGLCATSTWAEIESGNAEAGTITATMTWAQIEAQ
jgi:hypothetical protein